MGILNFLGLKREFGGVFRGEDVGTAIEIMKNDGQDFSAIIDLLSYKNKETNMPLADLQKEELEAFKDAIDDTSENRLERINLAPIRPQSIKVYSRTYRRNADIGAELWIDH